MSYSMECWCAVWVIGLRLSYRSRFDEPCSGMCTIAPPRGMSVETAPFNSSGQTITGRA